MKSSPIAYWHYNVGRFISDGEPEETLQPNVPTRMLRGVGLNRLGAGIDTHYIACEQDSYLIGKLEVENREGLTFIRSEDQSGQRFIAHWLIHKAPSDKPWMIGVLGKAKALPSLAISQPPGLCRFCESNGGFDFNLDDVREAHALIGDLPWKTVVAPAIHEHAKYVQAATDAEREVRKVSLGKLLVKTPELRGVLKNIKVRPLSGEYEVLSWYHRIR